MNNTPHISVVMSVYNSEKYLEEAIDSILTQTYTNFEFIIINDGSTDRSLEIIKEYILKDERIILISRENKGLPYSLNEGIKIAKGKYIARMDADDISLPRRFEEQIEFMEENLNVGICGTSAEVFGAGVEKKLFQQPTYNKALMAHLLFSSCFIHPTVIMRRSILDKYNLEYNINYTNAQDYELWSRISEYTQMENIQKKLLLYRISKDSITSVADNLKVEFRYKLLSSIFNKYLDVLNVKNSEEENKLHFNLTLNTRIRDNQIEFNVLEKYFEKIVRANKKVKLFDSFELKKVLGKKWLWNVFYKKDIKAIFSKYFIYGVWSLLRK